LSFHPELESEQAYITSAYACLERTRDSARQLAQLVETGAGGTHQARFERDAVEEKAADRLSRLELGAESLVFGRIDRLPVDNETIDGGEKFYIGRLPVSDADHNPVVIDWRAPVAEAFYRATGRNPLGLERRRHFATEGAKLLGIDDEAFTVERLERDGGDGLVGSGALLAALGRARTGHMRDIVATIQTEQDEIIRAELPGVIVVQGGPGTGKTAVALHRASYLLYTHRFPLERQGVLVVGPNRHFIRYISRVLPALGETGVDLAGVDDLYIEGLAKARDPHDVAQIKGDLRMVKFIKRAVSTRQRHLRDGLTIGVGSVEVTVTAAETAEMIAVVKRAHRMHNASRKHLQSLLVERLYQRYRTAMARTGRGSENDEGVLSFDDFSGGVKRHDDVRMSLDKMWPLLTPQMLLRDLFSAIALVKAAGRDLLTDDEQQRLLRPRTTVDEILWTSLDIPLLDEAHQLLGPLPKSVQTAQKANSLPGEHNHQNDEGMRTYGHIVIDESQDLAPMQLRMVARRSLSGSLTVVGDIGQATGMWAPKNWQEILDYLPQKRSTRVVELTVGYRTPSEIMDLAARVLAVAAPDLKVPTSVRSTGDHPKFLAVPSHTNIADHVITAVDGLRELLGGGTIGVLCPDSLLVDVERALVASPHVLDASGLQADGVTLLPVRSAKGLEFDGVVVIEPARVVSESAQGLRALFVALTRSTRALTIVHAQPLPECMNDGPNSEPNDRQSESIASSNGSANSNGSAPVSTASVSSAPASTESERTVAESSTPVHTAETLF
jgi:DNA helicase IV